MPESEVIKCFSVHLYITIILLLPGTLKLVAHCGSCTLGEVQASRPHRLTGHLRCLAGRLPLTQPGDWKDREVSDMIIIIICI